jgi:hypothetical protein
MSTSMRLALCVAAAAGLASGAGRVFAQAFTYNRAVQTGNWSDPATWDGGEPTTMTPVAIDGGLTVTIDQFGEAVNLLDIGTIAGQTGNLNMTAGDLTVTDSDVVTEPNLTAIRLGQVAGSTGNMSMSGGTVFIDENILDVFASGDLMVGDNGAGSFTMTGGDLTAADEIFVGFGAGSSGTVNVSGGTLSTSRRAVLVGFGGANPDAGLPAANATLNLSGTGTINVAGRLYSSFNGSTSTINMSDGTMNVSDWFLHGFQGESTFNHTGGDLNVLLYIVGDFGTGTYNISGDAALNLPLIMWVGGVANSQGFVNQTGGTINTGALTVGRDGTGAYEMSAGALNQTGSDGFAPNNHLIIGQVGNADNTAQGTGTYIQTGGTVTVATGVFLGDYDNSEGTYKISGGTLNVTGTGAHPNPGTSEDFIGDFSVGGALAANADVNRVDPANPNDPQGQALDANGTFIVSGSAATINIAGNFLANPADKHPNRSDVAPGDNRNNSATLGFEIFDSSGASLIDVGGVADLDGAVIDLDLMGGFTPTVGATFDLLEASSFGATGTGTTQNVGTGEGFMLASEDAGMFSLAVVTGSGVETLRATFLGGGGGFTADFDNDGDVDGADLTVWRNNFGPTDADGDADGDGDSDGSDFLTWQQQVGSGLATPAASAIPEPSAALLLGLAVAAFAVRRRCQ